jgi:hypothetical protein
MAHLTIKTTIDGKDIFMSVTTTSLISLDAIDFSSLKVIPQMSVNKVLTNVKNSGPKDQVFQGKIKRIKNTVCYSTINQMR